MRAVRPEHLQAAARPRVGDEHVARAVDGDALGPVELARPPALFADAVQVPAVGRKDLDPAVLRVGDEHVARAVDGHVVRRAERGGAGGPYDGDDAGPFRCRRCRIVRASASAASAASASASALRKRRRKGRRQEGEAGLGGCAVIVAAADGGRGGR